MEFLELFQAFSLLLKVVFVLFLSTFLRLVYCWWILPVLAYRKLKKNGFGGPNPSFPLGNISEMKKKRNKNDVPLKSTIISHDIHSTVFPYFASWQKSHGKVFIYWLGTSPFLYVADPAFLKVMTEGVLGKDWGKPNVFKRDRKAMFGKGLVMVEGNEWLRHRRIITPAFSPANLKGMTAIMVDSTNKMLDNWHGMIDSGNNEIEIETEIIATAGDIIAKTSFGLSYQNKIQVLEKLRALQVALFKTNRYVGVPYGNLMCRVQTLEAGKLGEEIDNLFASIIDDRIKCISENPNEDQKDLLSLLIIKNQSDSKLFTTRELVDECKTFFFGGHETTALAITWTLMLLAMHPDWQDQLREEIRQVVGDKEVDFTMLAGLKKMGWVFNEVIRLYSPAPNAQRQARQDIRVGDLVIPKGTNIWIDVVSMHHDLSLWGQDANEFKPERFKDDIYGGCCNKMGFLPFGFGGRMCVGRNLTVTEYKIVLTLIISRFSFTLSPNYCHSPSQLLSLRPSLGLPLKIQAIKQH